MLYRMAPTLLSPACQPDDQPLYLFGAKTRLPEPITTAIAAATAPPPRPGARAAGTTEVVPLLSSKLFGSINFQRDNAAPLVLPDRLVELMPLSERRVAIWKPDLGSEGQMHCLDWPAAHERKPVRTYPEMRPRRGDKCRVSPLAGAVATAARSRARTARAASARFLSTQITCTAHRMRGPPCAP